MAPPQLDSVTCASGCFDERSECKPDRAQPSRDERSECKADRAQRVRTMTFKEIAHAIMAASAADETEVVYRRHDESLTRFANNHIHQNVTETDHEIAVRCVSGSRCGIAVSNIVHPESLRRLAQLALELAKQ